MNNLHGIKKRPEKYQTRSLLEKFFLHVQVAASGCWIWKTPQKDGRCQFYDGDRQLSPQTWAYRFFKRRPVPANHILKTTCGDPLCVAPWHLKSVKLERALLKARTASVEAHHAITHCPHGHQYSEENTYYYKNALGHTARNCKTCMKERDRKRQENNNLLEVN